MLALPPWIRRLLYRPRQAPRRRAGRRTWGLLHFDTLESREVPAGITVDYTTVQDWGSGAQVQIRLTNPGPTSVPRWPLAFDFSANISSMWDAHVVSHVGNHYVVAGEAWDADLPAGGALTLGFVANPGGVVPTHFAVNGAPAPTPTPTPAPATGIASFRVTSDWGTGLTGEVTVTNPGPAAVKDWALAFDYADKITAIWNANLVSHTGNHYVVENAGWNAALPPGASVTFGFSATRVGSGASPTNFTLSDGAPAPGGTPANHPPVAQADTATTAPGQPVTVNVLANDSDPDGNTLSVTAATPGQHGSTTRNPDGTITYTPQAGFTGTDTFSYTVGDGKGGTATATVTVTVASVPASTWPSHVFAPYVDMTLYPTYDLAAEARNTGVRYFTLAFITADPAGRPSWGGYPDYAVNGGAFDLALRAQVNAVRALGGDVMVSFGGAAGQELAQVIPDVASLTSAYRTVVDAYNLTHLDFDIEGAAVADRASIDRRSQALAALQQQLAAAGKPLQVWFTLPALPTGLTSDGLYVVQSARRFGLKIAGVNVMAMDYGDGAAPNPQGHMGDYAVQAAQSLFTQLRGVYGSGPTDAQLWQMVGVTPMIGRNDAADEVFDQAAARELLVFAQQHGLGRLSMWSLNRDRQDPAGALSYATPTSSSILQQPDEFARLFEPFSG